IVNIAGIRAYDPLFEQCTLFGPYGPNLVNAFDPEQAVSGSGACAGYVYEGPPKDPSNDILKWGARAPFPYPTPRYVSYGLGGIIDTCPPSYQGTNFMRITWTGATDGSPQWIELHHTPAQPVFQNQGCDDGSGGYEDAGDWSCYDYIRFNFYMNSYVNNCPTEYLFQPVKIAFSSDNTDPDAVYVTFTADTAKYRGSSGGKGVFIPCQGLPGCADSSFLNHATVSLNFVRNQYNQETGDYYDINSVRKFIIPAVDTDYTLSGDDGWRMQPGVGEGFPPDSGSVVMYYDFLTLGAKDSVAVYDSPPGISVGTAPGNTGAIIQWSQPTGIVTEPGMPVTGFHVYRSIGPGNTGHPYISAGHVGPAAASFTDTSCPGDGTFCYKVLTTNNGPASVYAQDRYNTINATFHEPLLDDVDEVCGYVEPAPPTATPTLDPSQIGTLTATPTYAPPDPGDPESAHVYPNPFNPNMSAYPFKVDNAAVDSKISIYSMDGSLVKDGVISAMTGGFEWDGKNKNGSKVVAGLYYLVIEDPGGKKAVFRIIICYSCDPVYR
ncbi:MAG TPA: T9SS type A sorting domain-containing protein, partial [bacterium]|nr:T9SS type A sorting domain-containing protein [bacterium]